MARRQHGQGSLSVRQDRRGRETWSAKVRINGRQVKRALGPKRPVGSREGLTKTQAEARLSALILPLRTLQEWMGHRDFKTTLIYADYQPSQHESELVERAFAPTGPSQGSVDSD